MSLVIGQTGPGAGLMVTFCEDDALPFCIYSPNILRPMGPSLCLVEGGIQGTNPVMGLQS